MTGTVIYAHPTFQVISHPDHFSPRRKGIQLTRWWLTYEPIWKSASKGAPDEEQAWNTADLIAKAAQAVFGFLNNQEKAALSVQPSEAAGIQTVRATLEQAVKIMKAFADMEKQTPP